MTDVSESGNQDDPNPFEILIVSEDPSIHGPILDSIKNQGVAVNILRDGRSLPQKLAARPDLILLDFGLPTMDGIAVCRQLKASDYTRDIPVVLMFASDDLCQRAQGFKAGAIDYLIKPLMIEEVKSKLETHIRQRTIPPQSVSQNSLAQIHWRKREQQSQGDAERLCKELSCEVCAELPLQERYFREIFYNAAEMMVLIEVTEDGAFKFLETNRAFETLMDAPVGSLRGLKLADVFEGPGRDTLLSMLERCLEARAAIEEEALMDLPSGRFILHSSLIPMFDDTGRTAHILAMSREITDRKQAEQQISFMSFILSQLQDAVFLVDPQANFRFRYVNDKACQSLGYSRDELLGMSVPDIDPDVDLEKANKINAQLQKQGFATFETFHRAKDGHVFPVENSASMLAYENQAMGLSVVRDISERKAAEAALCASEERMRLFFERQLVGMAITSPEKGWIQVNDKLCEMLGYTREELARLTWTELTYPEDLAVDTVLFERLLNGEIDSYAVEKRFLSKDDGIVFTDLSVGCVRRIDGSVDYVLVLLGDITERKHIEVERLSHLRFFESMDRVNRAIQGSNDLETVLNEVLDTVLAIFDCDRAFLVSPCDPGADSWSVPLERTRPEYPGALALGLVMPMDSDVAMTFHLLLEADGPVTYGPGNQYSLPRDKSEQFGFKSLMSMAIYPKADKPRQFGIHQCSRARVWTADEIKLFQEIGRRLADGLSSLLAYRNLQISERDYRALAENAPFGIARYDLRGRITYFNPPLEKILHITTAEAQGKRPTECFPRDIYQDYEQAVLQVAASGGQIEFELNYPGDDGLETGLITMVAERNNDGNINGVLAIGRNVTAQRRAETALKRSEALYRSMVGAMVEGVVVLGQDGKIVSINPAAEKIFRLPADKVQGKNLIDLPLPTLIQDGKPIPGEQHPAILTLHTGQPLLGGEMGLCQADGENGWISINSLPLFAEGELQPYAVVSTFHDITERKRIENTLKFIAQVGWQESGESFLVSLACFMAEMLKVDYVLVDKLAADPAYAETVVVFARGEILPNMQYSLTGTPCDNVMEGALCCYPENVQQHFPEDTLLVDMQVESYVGMPLRDSGGKPIGLIAVMDGKLMQDQNMVVSILQLVAMRVAAELEREKFERALAESRQFLRRVIDTIADPVIVKDRRHRWILVNEAFSKHIGYPQEGLLGKSDYDFFPQKEADEFWLNDEAVFNNGEENVNEASLTDRNGITRTIITKKTRYIDDSGEMILVGIILDITERKQMEATIRKREEEFRTLAENLPDVIVRYDTSFRRTYINKVYSKMLEPVGADILGKTPMECWKVVEPDAHEFTRLLQRIVDTGNPESTLIQAETSAGKMIYWTMKLVPEFDQDGRVNGVLSCANDITVLKEYQREIEESRTQLRALATRSEKLREDERKRLARDLHDDLGQRLTALKLDLARLMMRFGRGNPELQQQVQEMDLDMAATIQIVRDVATSLRPSALEMGIVSALEWLVLEFRKRTNVECRLRIPKRNVTLNDSQATALFRIIQESLTNIMRYAMASKVEIILACDDENYVLEISDDGVGFDAHKKRKAGSYGLIGIEERALSLGGDMRIETAPNKGLKLTVCIPVFHTNGEEL